MARFGNTDPDTKSIEKTLAPAIQSAVAQALNAVKQSNHSTRQERMTKMASAIKKEAVLARHLATEEGLRKIAANMANPVRAQLDYKGISRKFSVINSMYIEFGHFAQKCA